jgi:hypothetical protein
VARKKTGRRRGRPINPRARRRQTTRRGRRGEPEPVDEGTTQPRAKKLRTTTRADVELTGAGILFGCELLDRQQYDVLDQIAAQLRLVARGWGISTGGVSGLWSALLAMTRTRNAVVPVPAGAEAARYRLARALARLYGSRALVTALAENRLPPLVERVVARRLTRADAVALENLRRELDLIASRRS